MPPAGARTIRSRSRSWPTCARDLDHIGKRLNSCPGDAARPWDALWRWGEADLTLEGQEVLLALVLEPHGALVDDLAATMSADESASFRIDGAMPVAGLRAIMQERYGWALRTTSPARAIARASGMCRKKSWSPGWASAPPMTAPNASSRCAPPAWRRTLHAALDGWPEDATVAAFLLRHPEHRFMARRAQIAARHPYAEVRDNLIAADMLPIDLMRCKLAFFGASHFDPRSDKWVRISLFQGAPYPLDLTDEAKG